MTTQLANQNWTKQLNCVFYAQYITPEVIGDILNRFPAELSEEAFRTLLSILDYTALGAIAALLPNEAWQAFIAEASIKYNNGSLLDELARSNPDLLPSLQQAIERQLLAIHSELEN